MSASLLATLLRTRDALLAGDDAGAVASALGLAGPDGSVSGPHFAADDPLPALRRAIVAADDDGRVRYVDLRGTAAVATGTLRAALGASGRTRPAMSLGDVPAQVFDTEGAGRRCTITAELTDGDAARDFLLKVRPAE